MKASAKKRHLISWGLVLTLLASLIPMPVFAAEETPKLTLSAGDMVLDEGETWDYNVSVRQGDENVTSGYTVTWSTEHPDVAKVDSAGVVTAVSPGETKLTATATAAETVLTVQAVVTVSGITLEKYTMELLEKERGDLPAYTLFGDARNGIVSWTSNNVATARVSRDSYVDGLSVGKADVTAKIEGTDYAATMEVTVKSNQATSILTSVKVGGTLDLSELESQISAQCVSMTKSGLSNITGLSVSTDQGILFENYRSADEPGKGVAQSGNYYIRTSAVGPYFKDITFVPNDYYTGGTAVIQYTGVSESKVSFNGRIVITLEQVSNHITLAATATSPARFSGQMFSEVCQRATGSVLDHVTFSLPAGTRGTLYYDYVSDVDYDHKVDLGAEYVLSQLDDISFVPAAGFTGTVNIYYTGYTISNQRYTGEIIITVKQNKEGGPVYNIGKGSMVVFDEADFDDYCESITGETLDRVRFTIPGWDEGVLYYDYKTSNSTGTRVSSADTYYASRNPRIDRVTFVADEGFSGTVHIPFTGWDDKNTSFNGVVEINVRSTGSGDVMYSCVPGGYVKLERSDFNELCDELTDRSLNYITFQTLPESRSGVLYSGKYTANSDGTRVNRNTKYYASSLSNLYFWAHDDFNDYVEIAFTGVAYGGDSFTGVLHINAQEMWNEEIRYTATAGKLLTFDGDDFNDMAWDAVGENLRYVRFELPAKKEGVLYYDYKNNNSNQVSDSRNYYLNSSYYIDKVGFLPDEDFTGMVKISFKGYTAKESFYGVIEIYVEAGEYEEATVTYTTTYSPITFSGRDFEQVNSETSRVVGVTFGKMPDSSKGTIYYQYSGPNQYSWKADTGTEYGVNSSPRLDNLSFVPRANFRGRITIPYTATRANGSKFSGDVEIYVENSRYSNYFADMGSYDGTEQAAVDYLYENGIVSGVDRENYGPSQPIRRGDFALMLCKSFNLYAPPSDNEGFRDVSDDAYYAKAVNTLRYHGIVAGSGNNLYHPNDLLSRQDAILMVQKTLVTAGWSSQSADTNILYDYSDGNRVASYAREAMAYALKWELLPVSGYRLAPTENLTRVDMAQILYRALTY